MKKATKLIVAPSLYIFDIDSLWHKNIWQRKNIHMGERGRFVTPPSAELCCGMCKDVCQDPHWMCSENHAFCKSCLTGHVSCPTCNKKDVDPPAPAKCLERQIQDLQVYCCHSKQLICCPASEQTEGAILVLETNDDHAGGDGCEWTGKLSELVNHLRTVCKHAPVSCVWTSCKQTPERHLLNHHTIVCEHRLIECALCHKSITFRDVPDHQANQCPCRMVNCQLCDRKLEFQEMDHHVQLNCPQKTIVCEYAAFGCKETPVRSLWRHHCEKASEQHLHLVMGFAMSKIITLETQVESLQKTVTALTATIAAKEDKATVSALANTVATKEDKTTVTALAATVAAKEDSTTVTSLANSIKTLANTVTGKEDKTTVTALAAIVSAKEDSTKVTALANIVAGKEDVKTVTALEAKVNGKMDAYPRLSAVRSCPLPWSVCIRHDENLKVVLEKTYKFSKECDTMITVSAHIHNAGNLYLNIDSPPLCHLDALAFNCAHLTTSNNWVPITLSAVIPAGTYDGPRSILLYGAARTSETMIVNGISMNIFST